MVNALAAEVKRGRVVLVADDLTGACDSAAAWLGRGCEVRVGLEGTDWAEFGQAEVWAMSLETREMSAEEARSRVLRSIAALGPAGREALVFKKVDSAGRGWFGVEILAALEGSGAELALVAPAFPAMGRTVEGGVLRVRDDRGQDRIVELRGMFSGEAVGWIPAGSAAELRAAIELEVASGTRVVICDAMTEGDLERLVEAGSQVRHRVLWAGSAGLAQALADSERERGSIKDGALRVLEGRTMVFVGSRHPVTAGQVVELERGGRCAAVRVPCQGALEQDVRAAFATGPVGALVLTGGDTAAFVLRALGARSIRLRGEVARGIPWGVVEGGAAEGCLVVTKSGGFGAADALLRAYEFCEGRCA